MPPVRPSAFRPRPEDAIDSLVPIVGRVEGEVIFATCIDEQGFVGESECFASLEQPKTTLPMDELFYLPQEMNAAAVMFTSKSSGPITELHDCDVQFTERLIQTGRKLRILVYEHVLVEDDKFRLMSQCTDLWPTC